MTNQPDRENRAHVRARTAGGFPGRLALSAVALALVTGACDSIDSGSASGESGSGGGDAEGASLEGETIEFVVPYEPGGGYDTYTRLAAPYIEECSGATVVVENQPGAGGLLATSQTFASPPNELRIQITNNVGIVGAQIGGDEGVQFDVQEFGWLGRVSAEPNVMVAASDSDITSFEDVLNTEEPVTFAATGPGSNEYINSTVIPEVYGFPSRIVTGFDGGDGARAAVLAGDVDLHIQPLDSQLPMIESGEMRPILLLSRESDELVPDTPTIADFEPETEEQQGIIDSLLALTETGRGVAASPNLDEAQRAALEEAVACAFQNEDLVAEAEEQQRSIAHMSGSEMADLVDEVVNSPEAFQELVRESSEGS